MISGIGTAAIGFLFLEFVCFAIQDFGSERHEREESFANVSCLSNETCTGWTENNNKVWKKVQDLDPAHPAAHMTDVFMLAVFDASTNGRGTLSSPIVDVTPDDVRVVTQLFFSSKTLRLTIHQGVGINRQPVFNSNSTEDNKIVVEGKWFTVTLTFQTKAKFQVEFEVHLEPNEYMAIRSVLVQPSIQEATTTPSFTDITSDTSLGSSHQGSESSSDFVTLLTGTETPQPSETQAGMESSTAGIESSESGIDSSTAGIESSTAGIDFSTAGIESSKPTSETLQPETNFESTNSGILNRTIEFSQPNYETSESDFTNGGVPEKSTIPSASGSNTESPLKAFGWSNVLLCFLLPPLGLASAAVILPILQNMIQPSTELPWTKHADEDSFSVLSMPADDYGTVEQIKMRDGILY